MTRIGIMPINTEQWRARTGLFYASRTPLHPPRCKQPAASPLRMSIKDSLAVFLITLKTGAFYVFQVFQLVWALATFTTQLNVRMSCKKLKGIPTLLAICLVIIPILLIMSGDIEENPGPPKIQGSGISLDRVDGETVLDVDEDLMDVKEALLPVVSRWYEVGECLRLKAGDLEGCERLPPERALTEVVKLWLRKVYNVKKFGPPTWRRLVEVVARDSGGKNPALAEKIATEHPAAEHGGTIFRELQIAKATDDPIFETRSRIKKLEQKYISLVTKTEGIIKQQSPELTEFRNTVTCLPSWMKGEHYQQYITDNVSRISSFTTIAEFFVFLNGCWDYLNYHLLQHIVNIYGDDKTQQMMEQYISEVESFRKATSLELFWKAIPVRHIDVPSSLGEVIFKHSNLTSTSSLEDVEKFRQEFAHHYSLPTFTLILKQVRPGSVDTVWLMPLPVALFLRDQMAHVGAEFYQQMHVFEMTVDGGIVYDTSAQSTHQEAAVTMMQPTISIETSSLPVGQNSEEKSSPSSSCDSPLPPLESDTEQQDFNIVTTFLGVPHITQDILSYLDVRSLLQAEKVCSYWRWLIRERPIWRKHICEKVRSCSLWRNLFKKRGWSKYLDVQSGKSRKFSSQFYRTLYLSASRDIHSLQANWSRGKYTLSRTDTDSPITCLQCKEERIVSGHYDGTIMLFDRLSLKNTGLFSSKESRGIVWCLECTADVVISGSKDGIVRVWAIKTGDIMNKLAHHKETVYSLKLFSNILVTGSSDRTVAVWEFKSPTDISLKKILNHDLLVCSVDIDEAHIVSGLIGGTIQVWDAFTYGLIHSLNGHTAMVWCLQLRGHHLVSGSWDRTVRVWSIETQECLRTLQGHKDGIWSICFTEDRICSGSDDGSIKVWDFQAAITHSIPDSAEFCLATLKEHTGSVNGLHCDDFQLVTGSGDGSIVCWDFLDPVAPTVEEV